MDRGPDTPLSLTPSQARAMRDAGGVCAARAAASLSGLVGAPIVVGSPDLIAIDAGGVEGLFGGLEAPALGVLVPFGGDQEGNTLLVFSGEGADGLERLLFPGGPADSEEMRLSAFAEVGNILAGAFVSLLSRLTSRVLINMPPSVVSDMAGALLDELMAGPGQAQVRVNALVYPLSLPSGGAVKAVILLDPAMAALLLEGARRLGSSR